jgi:two-component system, LytTR family, response regulator
MRGEQSLKSFPEVPAADVPAVGYVPGAPIRVLVAEPDVVSRRLICSLVECEPEMTAECVDDSLMISAIQENPPELVILDANTNVIRRGESWDALGIEAPPATIVTAYDPSALGAFASVAVDTVVKPFNVERFETALDLAKSRIFRARTELQVADGWVPEESGICRRQFVHRLAVEEDEKIVLIRVDDIQWIQSLGKHIRLYAEEKSHLLRQSMKNLQAKLDPKRFLRVHRNAIVNLDHVDEFHLPRSGNMFVKLRNGVSLPLRRGSRNMLRKFLKQIY